MRVSLTTTTDAVLYLWMIRTETCLRSESSMYISSALLKLPQVASTLHSVTFGYVWGNAQTYRLQKDNRQELTKRGGLRSHWKKIPRTIRDAILLTQKLGKQYLWVDSLCLIQDDPDDLMSGIQRMDTVYEQSVLTIVAAYGSNATLGLPGVRAGSRKVSQTAVSVGPDTKLVINE
jgi:hypothetical protein